MVKINIEAGHPTAAEAMARLTNELYRVRASGVPCAKIIHGYGSTGKGGAIKSALVPHLRTMISRRIITGFIAGENFGPFSASAQTYAQRYRDLRSDIDWGRSNDGITVVFFK
ncbi:Smr domain-containing protein [Ruminococcaceae bacterium YRB3002]|nr:Smr domain-containing protein [Ruminococcaceae bacterium YRB3002]